MSESKNNCEVTPKLSEAQRRALQFAADEYDLFGHRPWFNAWYKGITVRTVFALAGRGLIDATVRGKYYRFRITRLGRRTLARRVAA